MLRKVECPICHQTVEIGENSEASCSRYRDGVQHKTVRMN